MASAAHRSQEERRIVVTDDDTGKLTAVTQALRHAGYCAFAAYDGASALELVVQLPLIDMLVTNTRLGVVDGPELMRRAREARPGLPIIHIIHEDGDDSPNPIPPDILTLREPFTPEQLTIAVRELLG
jgi:DNA-binding response OmpR family regulator